MVSDTSKVVIKRAVNEIQARTKKWWARHPGSDQSVAIVDRSDRGCGLFREITPKGISTGILICEGSTIRNREWNLMEENPIQIDTQEGTDWIIEYAVWELPKDNYTAKIQSAIIATTGMSDPDLAKLLKVKPADIKKWYTGQTLIPNKVINEIVKRFIYGN